ncbi:MAG: TrmH family RNA methyltransferase [Gemmatimonadota bacterium]
MLSQSEAKLVHALKARSGREMHGAFMVEGVRVVEELLAAGIDLEFALVSPTLEDSGRGRALLEALTALTTVRRLRERELRDQAGTETPQGVIVVARAPVHSLDRIRLRARSLVLVLDAIQDPGNLGTLIRSAGAFAADCVLALSGTVDYWNPKVVRSAAGVAFRLPLVAAATDETWSWLAANRFTICGADMAGVDVGAARPVERRALVVGNEGAGLRPDTRAHVTELLAIPMPGRAESLNVAVAAGILLYELSRANR